MRLRATLVSLVLALCLGTRAAAGLCALAPSLLAIDQSAEAALRDPSSIKILALEQAIGAFEVSRYALDQDAQFAAPIEQFLSSRMLIAFTYRASGPEALLRLAAQPDTNNSAIAMRALVSPTACADPSSPGQPGAPQNGASSSPIDGGADTQSDDIKAPPPPKTAPASKIESAMTVLSTPVSIFAIAVVTVMFGGLLFVAIRRKRRGYARFICFLPVNLTINGEQCPTHLIEISQSGAKVSVTTQIDAGMKLSIRIDGESHEAKAVWATTSCVGVQFDTIIPSQQFSEILEQNGGGFERETAFA